MSLNVEFLEQSFELVKPRANEFAASFYENLFALYPEAKPLFLSTDMEKQEKKLLNSLVLVVETLRKPEVLESVLLDLGFRHVNYGTLPEHYPLVGDALLQTFEQYLQEDWTPEVKQAWADAYDAITQIMFQGARYSPEAIASAAAVVAEKEAEAIAIPEKPIALEKPTTPPIPEEAAPEKPTAPKSSSGELKVELIQNSFEKIKPRGAEFAASFYQNLFEAYPEAKPLFATTDMEAQEKKLLNSLVMVVEGLRQPEVLAGVLRDLGSRHVNYGTLKPHYPLVSKTLVRTLAEYLQEDWTPELKTAWVYALGQITKLMLEGADYPPEEVRVPKITTAQKTETAPAPKSSSGELKVELIQNSFEKIKPRGGELAASFYQNLFEAYPEAKPLFATTDMEAQEKKLLNSLVMVVEGLRQPEVLAGVLRDLGSRHVNYGTLKPHYPLVSKTLVRTLAEYLQEDWTPELKTAWVYALGQITKLMLEGADYPPEEVRVPKITTAQKTETAPAPKSSSGELKVELIQNSFEKIKPRGGELAASFYQNLFESYPEAKPLFANTDLEAQEKKLLNSLVMVVEGLRHPEILAEVLRNLGARHVNYGTLEEHYPLVTTTLVKTLEQYLQEDWTPELETAWVSALDVITQLMLEGAGGRETTVAPPPEKVETPAKKPLFETKQKSRSPKRQKTAPPPQKRRKKTERKTSTDWDTAKVTKTLGDAVNYFWKLPKWLIAIATAVILIIAVNLIDEDSTLAKTLESAEAISLFVALVLYIREVPERKKTFHYHAWSRVDAAEGLKDCQTRFLALQDLNEDGVSLRRLKAPGANLEDINLNKANLSEANLKEADFANANLKQANLSYADLSSAILSRANLSKANLSFSKLGKSNFSSADLSDANLAFADLSGANMSGANLTGASLTGSRLEETYLVGANLKDAQVSIADLSKAYIKGAIMPDGSKHP